MATKNKRPMWFVISERVCPEGRLERYVTSVHRTFKAADRGYKALDPNAPPPYGWRVAVVRVLPMSGEGDTYYPSVWDLEKDSQCTIVYHSKTWGVK